MQGIPSFRDLSFGYDICSFSQDDRTMDSRTAMMGQAGNAMHSEAVSIIWLYILSQCNKTPPKRLAVLSSNGSVSSCVARLFLQRARL